MALERSWAASDLGGLLGNSRERGGHPCTREVPARGHGATISHICMCMCICMYAYVYISADPACDFKRPQLQPELQLCSAGRVPAGVALPG